MNQKADKPLSEFTDKQIKSYKLVMKKTAKQPLSRPEVYKLIKKAGIYQRKRDIKETAKMLIKNSNTPISIDSEDLIVNEFAGEKSAN